MRVAILEDDPDQAEIVAHWLRDAEHTVRSCPDAGDFLRAVRRDSYDMYVLDWMLPDLSGIEVLTKLRTEMNDFTPVIIATAKNDENSVVRGLESGADDYLIKPIRRGELIARVSAVIRRASGGEQRGLDVEPYSFDFEAQSVAVRGETIALTHREFALAAFLFQNAGKMLSRSHILEAIWGIENASVSTRTVDTHMSRLRKKLALGDENGWKLSAVYQHGYRIERVGVNDAGEDTE